MCVTAGFDRSIGRNRIWPGITLVAVCGEGDGDERLRCGNDDVRDAVRRIGAEVGVEELTGAVDAGDVVGGVGIERCSGHILVPRIAHGEDLASAERGTDNRLECAHRLWLRRRPCGGRSERWRGVVGRRGGDEAGRRDTVEQRPGGRCGSGYGDPRGMDRPDRRRGAARGGGKQDRGCGKAQSAPNVSSEKRGHDMIIRAERS